MVAPSCAAAAASISACRLLPRPETSTPTRLAGPGVICRGHWGRVSLVRRHPTIRHGGTAIADGTACLVDGGIDERTRLPRLEPRQRSALDSSTPRPTIRPSKACWRKPYCCTVRRVAVFAYCLMPNHWHLVASPTAPGALSIFMHRLTTTHARLWHRARGSAGEGAVYQGRFSAIPIQCDRHFLIVCRYVERNALRASLVSRAEDWPWSQSVATSV